MTHTRFHGQQDQVFFINVAHSKMTLTYHNSVTVSLLDCEIMYSDVNNQTERKWRLNLSEFVHVYVMSLEAIFTFLVPTKFISVLDFC